jgi:AraC-like DNA-binding protein
MDGARLSRFPHLSWLRFSVMATGSPRPLAVTRRGACHALSLTAAGRQDVRWITRGRERQWGEGVGTVHFLPADDERHTFLTRMSTDFVQRVILLPREHFHHCLMEEGCGPPCETCRLLVHDDTALQACIARLWAAGAADENALEGRCEEAARLLVLRITELTGGGRPDWHDDESVFEARELRHVVAVIDEQRRIEPTLADMAMLVGLSPSHFARKFRATTGLSLHRFINRRRIRASLERLKDQSQPLAHVALHLGFSSQSHFTRVFSGLTGMTPARYRKQFKRTAG